MKRTYRNRFYKIAAELFMGIGFAAVAVLNCDSAVLALFCVFFILLWMSFYSWERRKAFARIVITALTAVVLIGCAERIFSAQMVKIDTVYLKAAQSPYLILLLVAVILYDIFLTKKKESFLVEKKHVYIIHVLMVICLLAVLCVIAVLFILHGKGYFPNSPIANYFHFTVWWGNSRGFIWRTGAAVFSDFDIGRKLFGCGPDCFAIYAYQLMGDAINEFWHYQIVPNVHNEWFNAVINYGLVGGAFYLGIFLTSAKRFLAAGADKLKEKPVLLGIGLAVIAYIAHNIFCYQQIVGTPAIFILMGIGEAYYRTNSLFLK